MPTEDREKIARRGATKGLSYGIWPLDLGPPGNSGVAAAIFDQNLHCVGFNDDFSACTLLAARPRSGQTADKIFTGSPGCIEGELRSVLRTSLPILNIEIQLTCPESSLHRQWIADFFPVRAVGGQVALVGLAMSEITQRRKLERSLSSKAVLERLTQRDGIDFRRVFDRYLMVSRQSMGILEFSTSLRRHMSCLRMASRLGHRLCLPWTDSSEAHLGLRQNDEAEGVRFPEKVFAAGNGDHPPSDPSPRELQVLELLAQGKSNKEIGAILQLSTRTVESYRARLKVRLKLHSEAEMVRYAIRNHIIDP